MLLLGGICALITAATTFVVHLISVPSETFEQRLLLSENNTYIFRNITVIVHCLCVSISMAAIFAARRMRTKSDYLSWGLAVFVLFSFLEISRMLLALIYANGLRSAFLQSNDPQQQELIRFALEVQWPLISSVLFIFFILAFGFGCLFMGIGFYRKDIRMDLILAILFLCWSLQSFVTFANSNLELGLDELISFLSVSFQPATRLFIAFWLFSEARSLKH